MQRELTVTVPRSWFLASVSTVALAILIVGLWVGINFGAAGQTTVVSASFDTETLTSSQSTPDGYGIVKGAACSGTLID